jgi:lipopolysaccharide transport system ATP-binding protein
MSKIVIKVENLSKQYRLGEVGTGTLAHDLNRWWHIIRGKEDPYLKIGEENNRNSKGKSDYVWALKDINFNLNQGEVLGIIGRNGAGKSTLLKILSRTTSPTYGEIKIKGRVASLLEVGTGFHPDLSGRDNVFLNGTILGMTKNEIKNKFDEIVDFAGVGRYIDTPVKRYSSGMYVRLAFAVAAHLDPDILIVDEVLAVGDAEFQQKALGKMQQVSKSEGRSVIFVSHNMAAINQLCTTCISLKNGQIQEWGTTTNVVSGYLNEGSVRLPYRKLDVSGTKRKGNKKVEFLEVSLLRVDNLSYSRIFSIGETIIIRFALKFQNPNQKSVKTAVELRTSDGLKLANMIDIDSDFQVIYEDSSPIFYEVELRDVRLYPDTYFISLYAGDMSSEETYDFIEDCISFEIIDGGKYTTRRLPRSTGLLFLTPKWVCKGTL